MPNKIVLVHSANGPDIYHYGVKGQKWGVITKKEDAPSSGRTKNVHGYTEGTYRRDQDEGGIGGGSQTPGVNGSGYYHPSASNTEKKSNVEKVQENYTEAVMGLGLGAAKAVLEGKMSHKDAQDKIWQTMLDLDNRRKNEPGFEYQLQLGDGTQLFANSQTNNMSQFFQDAMYILRIVCDEADKGPAYKKAYLDAINNGDFFKSAPSSGKYNKDIIKFALSDIKRQVNSMPKAQSKLATASKKSLNDSKKKTMLSTINQNNKNSSKNKSKVSGTKAENATVNKPKHMGSIASKSKKELAFKTYPPYSGVGIKTSKHNYRKEVKPMSAKHSDNNDLILVHSAEGPDVQHWGIKGQKWGVRRWQYEDGSLTPEGRIHYGRISEKGQQEGRFKGSKARMNTREFNQFNRTMSRNASKYEKTGKRKYAEKALENAEALGNEDYIKRWAKIHGDQLNGQYLAGIPGQLISLSINSSKIKENQKIWNKIKEKYENMSIDELDKAFNNTIGKTEKQKFNAKEMNKETQAKEYEKFKSSKEYREIGGQYKNEKEARKAYETHKKEAQENEKIKRYSEQDDRYSEEDERRVGKLANRSVEEEMKTYETYMKKLAQENNKQSSNKEMDKETKAHSESVERVKELYSDPNTKFKKGEGGNYLWKADPNESKADKIKDAKENGRYDMRFGEFWQNSNMTDAKMVQEYTKYLNNPDEYISSKRAEREKDPAAYRKKYNEE